MNYHFKILLEGQLPKLAFCFWLNLATVRTVSKIWINFFDFYIFSSPKLYRCNDSSGKIKFHLFHNIFLLQSLSIMPYRSFSLENLFF